MCLKVPTIQEVRTTDGIVRWPNRIATDRLQTKIVADITLKRGIWAVLQVTQVRVAAEYT